MYFLCASAESVKFDSYQSLKKLTVSNFLIGSIGSGVHGVTRSLPTLPGETQLHRSPVQPNTTKTQFPGTVVASQVSKS